MITPEAMDPIKKMIFRIMLCDLKVSIQEDPLKAFGIGLKR